MSADPDHIGWLPNTWLSLLASGHAGSLPSGQRFDAAVLLADVAGFTALTERYAQSGPAGAEQMSELLNRRFGALIAITRRLGGDITHFAGDAIIAIWRASSATALTTAAQRAAQCALEIQALPVLDQDAALLPIRAGVSVGSAWWAVLGDADDQAFVVGGQPVLRAGAAAAAGQPGEVIVSAEAWALLQPMAGGSPLAGSDLHRLNRLDQLHRLDKTPRSGVAPLPEAAPLRLLPRVLRQRLATGGDWLAEFRRVTVLFASFGDIDFAAPPQLDQAQAAIRSVLGSIARYDGMLHQLVADGPGAVLIAAWGLPSVLHEDDARRGIEAALSMARELKALGLSPAIGVATGRVFCGVRGSPLRRDWAIMGDGMNLAARLMRAAGSGVLCDADTANGARQRLDFEPLPAIQLKGKSRPVAVLRPIAPGGAPRASIDRSDSLREAGANALVGRGLELERIEARLAALDFGRPSDPLILEGEAGIGKSTLLREIDRRAVARGFAVLRGDADAIESATAYFVWRPVMRQLFAGPHDEDTASLRTRVMAALGDDEALRLRAPLLNDLLALDLPDSEVTAPMEPQGRADALRDLVAALLARHARAAPLVVILDDAHWFDSASWALTAAVVRRAPQLLFVLGMRPIPEPRPLGLDWMLASGANCLALQPLASDDVLRLVCGRLGVPALPAHAAALLRDKAQGNPFFSEQLALALRDSGHLVVEAGQCRLADEHLDLDKLDIPNTVQGVVTGRIDRLAGGEQLTLKVASVIGRVFGFRVLHEVYPVASERSALHGHLDHLTRIDLTRLDKPEPDLSHLFTQVITQQVAYDLMSFAQRRQMHQAVAGWFEQAFRDDLTPYLQLLAHHWSQTDDAPKALEYLERCALQALERFANEEVLRFIAQAKALAQRSGRLIDDQRRSRWEWYEGEALLKLARYTDSRDHFLASLRLLGRPVPATRAGLVARMMVESLRQLRNRWWGTMAANRRPESAAELQAVHLHQRLAEVGYWEHDILSLVHSAVTSLNIAEPVGMSRQLQLAHQVMGFVSGLAGSATLFEHYRRRAAAVASAVVHLETAAFCAQLEAIYFNGQARWSEMETAARRGGALFERIGDRFRWQTCVVLRAWGTLHQGEVAAARALFEEAEHLVRAEGPTQVQVWCSAGLLAVEMATGPLATAERVAELERLLARGVDHSDAILCRGLLAKAHHRAGDRRLALAHARQATALIDKLPPASFHTLLGNAAVAELRLAQWQLQSSPALRAEARHAIRGLWLFTLACPIGRPWLWRARAEFARLDGRPARAQRCLARAQAETARLGMRVLVEGVRG